MKLGLTLAGIVVVALIALGCYVSGNNTGNRFETQLDAQYNNMQNVLAQYSLKVTEVAQVPTMAKDDLKEVAQAALSGRYGPNGSQAVFQWIQENYPGSVDPQLYRNLQQIIEGGRNKFENEQTLFLDQKKSYKAALGNIPGKWFLSWAGYPKKDPDSYKLITSIGAAKTFETGVDEGIQLRPAPKAVEK
jgi:hypothetical protein